MVHFILFYFILAEAGMAQTLWCSSHSQIFLMFSNSLTEFLLQPYSESPLVPFGELLPGGSQLRGQSLKSFLDSAEKKLCKSSALVACLPV